MSGKVIVVAESATEKYNLDGLYQFGDVTYLYSKNERKPTVYNGSQFAVSLVHRLKQCKFDAERDYIAMIGRQVEVGFLFYVLGLLVGDVKIVFFDAAKAEYAEGRLKSDAIPDFATT